MSSFLTGLLNRAKGMEATLQRRRPSLFEPNNGLLAGHGDTSELPPGETDYGQINVSDQRDTGTPGSQFSGISPKPFPYITPNQEAESASPIDVSIRFPEQHTTGTQFSYNKPGIASGEGINHMEQVQTAHEIQIEKHTRSTELNTADPRADGMTERPIGRVVPMISPQHIETIREFQIERPRNRSLTDTDNPLAIPAKAETFAEPTAKAPTMSAPLGNQERVGQAEVRVTPVQIPKTDVLSPKPKEQVVRDMATVSASRAETSAESAAKASTMSAPLGNQERVVHAEVRVTPVQIPKTDVLSPKPKEQVVRDMATMSASRVRHNTRRESANFSATQQMAETVPTIQVTIGRIEVRATQQAASSPARTTRSSAPKLSLEDYLRQRSGGGR